MRKIPAVMATQHPDNAGPAYWEKYHRDGFVSALAETKECEVCFAELGVDEYMWDWEGKHADAAVVDKLLSDYHEFFKKHQLGRDIFLTFRLPNIWQEKGYSLIQAMTAILIAEDMARDFGFKQRPLFEVILPMTERAEQLLHMHKLFGKLAQFKSQTFNGGPSNSPDLELIPLVEGVESQLAIGRMLERYLSLYKRQFGRRPDYIRPFLARSDPAMASGMLATVLANKLALSQINQFEKTHKLPVHTIVGVGSLPFRGGLSPQTISRFLKHNPGVKTVTIQSSFRYDHSQTQVKKAIKELHRKLPRNKIRPIVPADASLLEDVVNSSAKIYQATIRSIAADLAAIFKAVPKRRERRLHIGLLAYQRSIGKQALPRAITFTAGFYSIGVPPEFIGLGRSLSELSEAQLRLVLKTYTGLVSDVEQAGRYLNRQNLERLAEQNKAWKKVINDIELTESALNLKLGPRTYEENAHVNLSSTILLARNNPKILTNLMNEAAILRKSLG